MEHFTEIMTISEHPGSVITTLLSNEVVFEDFENRIMREQEDRDKIVRSLFTLARADLIDEVDEIRDIFRSQKNPSGGLIEISSEREHKEVIMTFSFLMNEANQDFALFIFFGGKANPQTSVLDGTLHAIEVLSKIQSEY